MWNTFGKNKRENDDGWGINEHATVLEWIKNGRSWDCIIRTKNIRFRKWIDIARRLVLEESHVEGTGTDK